MKKGNNNKGFSLVELLVAVALLAIIITPVLASFVTSAKINRNSRMTMTATDVGQTIMEGFTDKTFLDLVGGPDGSVYSKLGSDLTGNYALSCIDEGVYNLGTSHQAMPWFSELSSVKANGVTYNGVFYDAKSLTNHDCDNQKIISKQFLANAMTRDLLTPKGQALYTYSDGKYSFFVAYKDIEFGGRHYDAVASVLPCADKEDDEYYTCSVVVIVYNRVEKLTDVTEILNGQISPLIVLTSGMKNQQ